jgi:leucyl aminopeptidase (aminopeptidase T)
MSDERNGGEGIESIHESAAQIDLSNEDPHSWAAINRRLAARVKELHERDSQIEGLSMGTGGTVNLTFDPPGGPLWQHNHPDS